MGLVIWLLFFLNSFSFAFYHCFYDAGKRYGLDPLLLTSIAKVESNFNPRAINLNLNGSVDYGIMQVNSYWLEKYKIPKDWIKEPCYNIHFGAMVLRRCMDIHRGSLALAVDCYNKGSRAKGHGDYVERVFKSYKRYHAMLK